MDKSAVLPKIDSKENSYGNSTLKRLLDLFVSAFALLILSPLFLIVSLLILATSKGPVIFAQKRVGKGGTSFSCYKFRTMEMHAEKKLKELLCQDPALKQVWMEKGKLTKDPRVTKIGRFLRKTSLDELPQFWNVLKGDLSVVGPRPIVSEELNTHYRSIEKKFLSIKPGITGLWQVSGRSNTTYQERRLLDEIYIDKQSFTLDIKLILQTIPHLFHGKGAY